MEHNEPPGRVMVLAVAALRQPPPGAAPPGGQPAPPQLVLSDGWCGIHHYRDVYSAWMGMVHAHRIGCTHAALVCCPVQVLDPSECRPGIGQPHPPAKHQHWYVRCWLAVSLHCLCAALRTAHAPTLVHILELPCRTPRKCLTELLRR
jgi:hypothetical protein